MYMYQSYFLKNKTLSPRIHGHVDIATGRSEDAVKNIALPSRTIFLLSDSCATQPKNAPSTYSQVPVNHLKSSSRKAPGICRWPGEEIVLEETDCTGERRRR